MRILIVDGNERVSRFVARGLETAGFRVDIAASAAAAVLLLAFTPDLVLLDLLIAGSAPLGLLSDDARERREEAPPVIVVSEKHDAETRLAALTSGACDFLEKPFLFDELLLRVNLRLREHRAPQAPGQLAAGEVRLDLRRRRVHVNGVAVPLSERELRLLEDLMRHAGEVRSRQQLLSSVWGYAHDPGTNLVEVSMARLRRKLGRGRIHTVRGFGYVLDHEALVEDSA